MEISDTAAAADTDGAAAGAAAEPEAGSDGKPFTGRRLANVSVQGAPGRFVPRPPPDKLEQLRLEAHDLTTQRAQQLCKVIECRLELFLESMHFSPASEGGTESVLPENAVAAMARPPAALMRQSTGVIQKHNPNVRVSAHRESRAANPDAADDTPLAELIARQGRPVETPPEDEEDELISFKTGRSDAALAAAKKKGGAGAAGGRPTLTPTQQARAAGASSAANSGVLSREMLKQRSVEVVTKSPPKKGRR